MPRPRRFGASILPALVAGALLLMPAGAARSESRPDSTSPGGAARIDSATVLLAPLHDAIGPASAHYLTSAIDRAEERRAAALVVELDTPGGLDDSMRDIVKRILSADVPVVVYVAPSGSRAASAGLFLLMAAHVAAMAPSTNTGAAHPVAMGGSGGQVDSTMLHKMENDAASFMRSLAQKRGRNVEWAESAVRHSVSASAEEALEKHVIDIVSPDLQSLLQRIDSLRVEVVSGTRRLGTAHARVVEVEMGWRDRVLSSIANPNVAYILLMLGSMGLIMELWNPGAIFPGVVGAISLLLAFFALHVLPVNHVGLLLILLGIVLFVLEIKVTSYGALTIGGIASLLFGSLLLFETPGAFARVSWAVIAPAVTFMTLFFLFVVGAGLRAQRRRPTTGREGMIGQVGYADSEIAPEGRVFVHGEYWQACSESPIAAGARIEVVSVDGRQLLVRRRGS